MEKKVKVVKFEGEMPTNMEVVLTALGERALNLCSAKDVLKVVINKDKIGNFVSTVLYVGKATTQEIKDSLDKGELPQLVEIIPDEPEAK